MGKKFIIRTDHKSLTWMLNWKKPNTSQYCSWIDELSMYDFEIQHRIGKLHANADALSREYQCEQCEIRHVDPKTKRNIKVSKSIRSESDNEGYRQINELEDTQNEYSEKKIKDILKYFHSRLGHPSAKQTLTNTKQYYEWENMEKDVEKFVANCMPCVERKQGNKIGYNIKNSFTATEPFEMLCCDITGPLPNSDGYSYILGIIDVFSRYVALIPLKDISAKTITEKLLERWIAYFGIPKIIHSDNGIQFKSGIMKELCNKLEIEQSFSAPYYHEGNGLIERVFRTAKDKLYASSKSHNQSWVKTIPYVELNMRSSISKKMNLSPYEILFGKNMNLKPDISTENIEIDSIDFQKKMNKQKQKISEIRRQIPEERGKENKSSSLKIGDLVMVKIEERGLLKKRFTGPWKRIKFLNNYNL